MAAHTKMDTSPTTRKIKTVETIKDENGEIIDIKETIIEQKIEKDEVGSIFSITFFLDTKLFVNRLHTCRLLLNLKFFSLTSYSKYHGQPKKYEYIFLYLFRLSVILVIGCQTEKF